MTLTAKKNGKKYLTPAAMIEMNAHDVSEHLGGGVIFDYYDTDGLGMALGHAFSLADGREIYLEQLLDSKQSKILVNCDHRITGPELKSLLVSTFNALAVRPEKINWVKEDPKGTFKAPSKPAP